MPRYALRIEYDGGPFSGWQAQADRPSVQGALEDALARLDPAYAADAKGGRAVRTAAAGRTDAGVHATAQVAHCDMVRDWQPFRLSEALNWHLKPLPVAITACAEVPQTFHARFSATGRGYVYRILTRRAPPVLVRGQVWHVAHPLDVAAMRKGAAHLIGLHDFTTFRSTLCQSKSPVKTLDRIEIVQDGDEVRFTLMARSFLHNQVRSVVGSLERVGAGGWHPDRMAQALQARTRAACGPVAPPQGLCLTQVDYLRAPF